MHFFLDAHAVVQPWRVYDVKHVTVSGNWCHMETVKYKSVNYDK